MKKAGGVYCTGNLQNGILLVQNAGEEKGRRCVFSLHSSYIMLGLIPLFENICLHMLFVHHLLFNVQVLTIEY